MTARFQSRLGVLRRLTATARRSTRWRARVFPASLLAGATAALARMLRKP